MTKKYSTKETPMDIMLASLQGKSKARSQTIHSDAELSDPDPDTDTDTDTDTETDNSHVDLDNVRNRNESCDKLNSVDNRTHSTSKELTDRHSNKQTIMDDWINRIIEIDPHTIRPWQFADRPESELEHIDELADDIKHNGQSTPILVRSLDAPDGQIQYEYIFGCRRIEACRKIGVKVKATVSTEQDLPDAKAFAWMFSENEQRQGISSWARCVSFQHILSSGIYRSKRELSISIGKHEDYIREITIYSRIPEDLTKAIGHLSKVSIGTAKEIVSLAKDERNNSVLLALADLIRDGISPSALRKRVLQQRGKQTNSVSNFSTKNGESISIAHLTDGFKIKLSHSLIEKLSTKDLGKTLIDFLNQHT